MLSSYPKSGNTWVKHIINCAEQGKPCYLAPRRYIECNTETVIKSHNKACDLVELGDAIKKVVHIVRDVRAIYYSSFNQTEKDIADIGTVQDMLVKGGDSRWHEGSWSEHVNGWLAEERCEVLIVRFEDMKQDTLPTFKRILSFLDLPVTDDELQGYLDHCSFEKMRRHYSKAGDDFFANERKLCEELGGKFPELSLFRDGVRFFWKGKVDAWRELPDWIIGEIEAQHKDTMAVMGYELTQAT